MQQEAQLAQMTQRSRFNPNESLFIKDFHK